MRIGIAADHGGFALKEALLHELGTLGFEIIDFGAHQFDPDDDYPDFVLPLARAVARQDIVRGLAICGSGVGACIAANKIAGVRACLVHEVYSAHQGVEHDAMNLLCLGGGVVGDRLARELITAFLNANYTGEARHQRRLDKIAAIECVNQDANDQEEHALWAITR